MNKWKFFMLFLFFSLLSIGWFYLWMHSDDDIISHIIWDIWTPILLVISIFIYLILIFQLKKSDAEIIDFNELIKPRLWFTSNFYQLLILIGILWILAIPWIIITWLSYFVFPDTIFMILWLLTVLMAFYLLFNLRIALIYSK